MSLYANTRTWHLEPGIWNLEPGIRDRGTFPGAPPLRGSTPG